MPTHFIHDICWIVPVDKIVEKIVEVDKERVVLQEVPVTTEVCVQEA